MLRFDWVFSGDLLIMVVRIAFIATLWARADRGAASFVPFDLPVFSDFESTFIGDPDLFLSFYGLTAAFFDADLAGLFDFSFLRDFYGDCAFFLAGVFDFGDFGLEADFLVWDLPLCFWGDLVCFFADEECFVLGEDFAGFFAA